MNDQGSRTGTRTLQAERTLHVSPDHLYSPAALTVSTGISVLERYEYDAYGTCRILDANFQSRASSLYANPYTFTGRQLDTLDNNTLHHMHYRHRDYTSKLGRFMPHDPLGMNLRTNNLFGPLLQMSINRNLFEYVISKPVNLSCSHCQTRPKYDNPLDDPWISFYP